MDNIKFIAETIKEITPNCPVGISWKDTYESIVFPEGYTKPSKADFDAKYNELVSAEPMKKLREERNKRLLECDFYFVTDFPYPTETIKQSWLTYRQALRDLPTTASPQLDANRDLTNITWPTPPS